MKRPDDPTLVNRRKSVDCLKEHREGIPCSKCGYRRWRQYSTRHVGNKIVRVRACLQCGHRIRTQEILESDSAPRMFARDPKNRRKVPKAA